MNRGKTREKWETSVITDTVINNKVFFKKRAWQKVDRGADGWMLEGQTGSTGAAGGWTAVGVADGCRMEGVALGSRPVKHSDHEGESWDGHLGLSNVEGARLSAVTQQRADKGAEGTKWGQRI